MVYRHIAFVHALRVFLPGSLAHNYTRQEDTYQKPNKYSDTMSFLSEHAYKVFCHKHNPPKYLLELQRADLRRAPLKGWLSDYPFLKLNLTQ
jgi:putative membrane protein